MHADDTMQDELGDETNKNLMEELEEDSNMMRVFLRVKPIADKNRSCIKFESETTIRAQPPKDSNTYKNKIQGVTMDHNFTFTKILGPEASQQNVFDETMRNILEEFIDGKNCLVFAYGATGAGKTHTIQGNLSDPGIMIRTLDVLFNTLESKLTQRTHVKPYLGQVTLLNEKGEEDEREYKDSILKGLPNVDFDGTYLSDFSIASRPTMCSTKLSGGSDVGNHSQASAKSQSSAGEFVSILSAKLPEEEVFSVWVSFAEVYNEAVYDLLDPKLHKKPIQLKVMTDTFGTGDVYIKNLSEVQVFSAEEAYKVLLVGRGNLKVAATKFNHVSSRSHSIFTVKLIKIPNVDDPGYFYINRLSFCDLAGSERSGKVNSCSSRLKEAGNINTSLMVLGRCIETLKHNQRFPNDKKPVPVRDSKLTRILQGFFLGIGRAYMVTNISQSPDQFDETFHVLKFSALAQQVVSQDLRHTRLSTTFLQPVDSSGTVSDETEEDDDGDVMNSSLALMFKEHLRPHHLLNAIVTLESKLVETINNFEAERREFKKELLKRELEVRAELYTHYQQERFEMEEEHRIQLCELSDQGTERVFQFMNTVMMEKKEPVGNSAVIIEDKRPACKDAESQVTPGGQVPVQSRISDKRPRVLNAVLQNVIRNTMDVATQVLFDTNDFAMQAMPQRKDVAIQVEMLQLQPAQVRFSNDSDNEENVLPNLHQHSKRVKKTVKNEKKFEELSPPPRNEVKQPRTRLTKTKKDDVTVSLPAVTPKLRKLRVRKAQI